MALVPDYYWTHEYVSVRNAHGRMLSGFMQWYVTKTAAIPFLFVGERERESERERERDRDR